MVVQRRRRSGPRLPPPAGRGRLIATRMRALLVPVRTECGIVAVLVLCPRRRCAQTFPSSAEKSTDAIGCMAPGSLAFQLTVSGLSPPTSIPAAGALSVNVGLWAGRWMIARIFEPDMIAIARAAESCVTAPSKPGIPLAATCLASPLFPPNALLDWGSRPAATNVPSPGGRVHLAGSARRVSPRLLKRAHRGRRTDASRAAPCRSALRAHAAIAAECEAPARGRR